MHVCMYVCEELCLCASIVCLTITLFGLHLPHLLKSFEHAPEISDAVFKGDLLKVTWFGIFQDLPDIHIHLRLLLLLLLSEVDRNKKYG